MSLDILGSEIISCPKNIDCKWKYLYNSEFNRYNLPIYECNNCKLQTIHPKDKLNIAEMYTEEYYSGKSEYSYRDERRTEKYDAYVWDARIRNIKKFVPTGNFLDIGCSFGGFLERARVYGYNPYGIEISEYSSDFARKRSIPVYTGNFLDADYQNEFFDVITMIEVIEHLEEPRLVFEKLYRYLRKGGVAVLQTANFEGKQAMKEGKNYHYYLPGHLYYYSRSNLIEFLSVAGFRKFKMYYGVDFPLYAKLLKSRGSFKTWLDYKKWIRISLYHWKSQIFRGSTSSMVLYAFK